MMTSNLWKNAKSSVLMSSKYTQKCIAALVDLQRFLVGTAPDPNGEAKPLCRPHHWLVLVLVLVRWWNRKLIGFWCPCRFDSSDHMHSWNHWQSLNWQHWLAGCSMSWLFFDWMSASWYPVLIYLKLTSCHDLANSSGCRLMWKTICCQCVLFLLISCTPWSCPLFLYALSVM